MAKCNFTIPFQGSAESLVAKAQTAIAQAGGTFNGSSSAGSFAISTPLGKVSGAYMVEGQGFNISIEDKPFLVGCGKIESTLREYLGKS
ncbi:hypothetical protein [Pedobacter sp. SYSU D00535]|uniref:hypothetical protein n=1 Tax=Pedobacter sp. SYSU D00535 TaxID=2810308 RepID=UPI001A96E80C|nr:hypothetical protein [Pedobacter sp. SYSU D00535]